MLSVGRVQTPILGLVVNRDNEIANFVAKPFYEVLAHLETQTSKHFLQSGNRVKHVNLIKMKKGEYCIEDLLKM